MMSANPPELVRERSISRQWRRLHALHCLGAVACRPGGEASGEFGNLVTVGWALPSIARSNPALMIYTITDAGRKTARSVF